MRSEILKKCYGEEFEYCIFDRLNTNTTFPLPQKHSVNHSKYKV